MQDLETIDKKYIWHPFTQMRDWQDAPQVVIKEGDGVYLIDTDGKRYIDGVSSLWANIHGHKKKEIDKAIKAQIDKVSHSTMLGLTNIPAIKLAEKLVKITPAGLNKVFFSDSGSEAVEVALKIAFQYWKQRKGDFKAKKKFVVLTNAYHGDTIGSVSLGGIDLFHSIFKDLLFETYKIPSPYCYRCPYDKERATCNLFCLTEFESILKCYHTDIAACVMEPLIQCAGGMITQPTGYLRRVRDLTKKYNILLILDEVAVGFGRTGKMFASEHEDITPDIMAIAKGLTGGYLPLAATLTTEEIYNVFLGDYTERKTFFHGHTYTGNPLCCACALANIEVFEKENVLGKLQEKIEFLQERLRKFQGLESVGDIRQCGFVCGIELVKNKTTKEQYPYAQRIGHKVILEARKQGLILRPLGDIIVIMPPLSITIAELEKLLDITYKAIKVITVKDKG